MESLPADGSFAAVVAPDAAAASDVVADSYVSAGSYSSAAVPYPGLSVGSYYAVVAAAAVPS